MILNIDIPLSSVCNYKIGGPADYYFEFKSREDLVKALTEYKEIDPSLESIFILGDGTNVLFSDEGFRGLVLKNSLMGISREDNNVRVSAGELFINLVSFATDNSLSGLEWAGGLPGTVGGGIRGNAGAFGGEVKDNLLEVEGLNINSLNSKIRANAECSFDYRQSVFKNGSAKGEIILSATFKLNPGNQEEIRENTKKRFEYRVEKHPLDHPNIGSTFKNIPVKKVPQDILEEFDHSIKQDPFPVLPVAKLIASTDLVGKIIGGAQISTKHPNFIINLGNAKAADVLELVNLVKTTLKEKFRVDLEEEIMIV